MIRNVTATLLLAAAIPSHAQTFSFSKTVIDADPYATGSGLNYDKLVDHFTAKDHLSYFLGTGKGAYLYDPASGQKITISSSGSHYERAKAFLYSEDTFPGIVASVDNTLVWYRNPANTKRMSAGAPWEKYVINPNSGCHDLHVVDLDGDGRQDILCSATATNGKSTNFVAFQNGNKNDWQIVDNFNPTGDGISIIAVRGVNGGARTNIVACNPANSRLYWFKNPTGKAARDPHGWTASRIGACNAGVAIGSLDVGGRDVVIVASNEAQPINWPNGLVYYDPGSTPARPWKMHTLDHTYRGVHEIATGTISGVPFFTVGEQEQASSVCNAQEPRLDDHPTVKGCRVAVFPWEGNSFGPPTVLSNLGTQNQEVLVLDDTAYLVGANHAGYKAVDPAFNLWQFRLRLVPQTINRKSHESSPQTHRQTQSSVN
jgi:hypothetical protein